MQVQGLGQIWNLLVATYLQGFGLTCLELVHGSQFMDLILPEQHLMEDRNVQLELPVVGVGTLVDVLCGEVFLT